MFPTRFDATVIFFLSVVALLIGVVYWRGDRVELAVRETIPSGSAASTRSLLRVTFEEPLAVAENVAFTIEPAVDGEVRVENGRLLFQPKAPLASETTYTVSVNGRFSNAQGRSRKAPITWQFRTGSPRILFISWDNSADALNQIYQIDPEGGAPQRLTQVPHDVSDFTVSPDGSTVLFTVFREEGGSDLWQMQADGSEQRMALDCAMALCSQAVFVPNSTRVIYERRTVAAPGSPPGLPRLWWFDTASGETVPLFEDSQILGLGATVSADGRFLSFVFPQEQGIQVYRLEDGSGFFIPNRMGSAARWHPESNSLLLSDIQLDGDSQWEVHLLSVDIASEAATSLSAIAGTPVDDSTAVYAPDGSRIAFGRKEPRTAMGRQLWLMDANGSNQIPLTSDKETHHGPFVWSADGRFLMMQQVSLGEAFAQPTLAVYDTETKTLRELTAPAGPPFAWIP